MYIIDFHFWQPPHNSAMFLSSPTEGLRLLLGSYALLFWRPHLPDIGVGLFTSSQQHHGWWLLPRTLRLRHCSEALPLSRSGLCVLALLQKVIFFKKKHVDESWWILSWCLLELFGFEPDILTKLNRLWLPMAAYPSAAGICNFLKSSTLKDMTFQLTPSMTPCPAASWVRAGPMQKSCWNVWAAGRLWRWQETCREL